MRPCRKNEKGKEGNKVEKKKERGSEGGESKKWKFTSKSDISRYLISLIFLLSWNKLLWYFCFFSFCMFLHYNTFVFCHFWRECNFLNSLSLLLPISMWCTWFTVMQVGYNSLVNCVVLDTSNKMHSMTWNFFLHRPWLMNREIFLL